jgi:hypothetical protein
MPKDLVSTTQSNNGFSGNTLQVGEQRSYSKWQADEKEDLPTQSRCFLEVLCNIPHTLPVLFYWSTAVDDP